MMTQGSNAVETHFGQKRATADSSGDALARELEEIRVLLDEGLSTEVQSRLTPLMRAARRFPSLLAEARCLLSASLEMQGRSRESLEAVAAYETPEARAGLDVGARMRVRVRLGLAYDLNGDHPKAIAILDAVLRESPDSAPDAQAGMAYNALASVYRNINEYTIAREHGTKALEHFRHTGDWRGLAEGCFGMALAELFEGSYEAALEHFEHTLKLIGERPASYLLGKIYNNMAGACWFLRRPHEGIRLLEKAVTHFERYDHKANAVNGYNNLGNNLTLIGDWARAQKALERALALASEVDERGAKVPMILDSLGKLRLLRGEHAEARALLERAVALSAEHGNKWYAGQARLTLGRCRLASNDAEGALEEAGRALELGERIGDRHAVREARLLLAEAHVERGDLEGCEAELRLIAEGLSETNTGPDVIGEAERLAGMLALARGDAATAARHFGRSLSVFEMLGDRYRIALGHWRLGQAYSDAQPARAKEHFNLSSRRLRELGAAADLARCEESLAALGRTHSGHHVADAQPLPSLVQRLTGAATSRDMLLFELAAILRDEAGAKRILITERRDSSNDRVLFASGWSAGEGEQLARALSACADDDERRRFDETAGLYSTRIASANAAQVTLTISPADAARAFDFALAPLLRVLELGLEVCALRAKPLAAGQAYKQDTLTELSKTPGFIHSSPAMTRLVEEMQRIRSSGVTVLITGESGTGKELIARAVHDLSARREKVFIPFNCTAVPKELSEGYLFGYRRGAFTGAVSDSQGVIRTAASGTLFLDEIGDLPLDVQPKLLRFLQEGEIQPLGEQRPQKVDVRIIAATNTDLEAM
ncbi:MAG: hypothetical protein QOJ76_1770, partial [Acidobacteriota bacterium]|nr:hypothetical protein [Acidobacteriota bacterium]